MYTAMVAGESKPGRHSPLLSVIIVNYNSGDYLAQALRAIVGQSNNLEPEIMVVDNGSTDDSVHQARTEFPQVAWLLAAQNLGFARANNWAIRESKGKYILLLNPDTVAHDWAVSRLVSYLEGNPGTGIVGPKIMGADREIDFRCARRLPSLWGELCERTLLYRRFPRSRWFARHLMGDWDHGDQREVEAVSGACLFIRREVIDEVGLLDEGYFMFGEDMDWCWRVAQAGWKIVYVPDAVVTHVGGRSSTPEMRGRLVLEGVRSHARFFAKRFGSPYVCLYRTMMAGLSGVKWALFALSGLLPAATDEAKRAYVRRRQLQGHLLRWALTER